MSRSGVFLLKKLISGKCFLCIVESQLKFKIFFTRKYLFCGYILVVLSYTAGWYQH